ncbi:MAG: hypothetical protein KDK36_12865 [Leptospiraceae bacterium]|nr:hypothetical protein [Leptospiraceae bacterium]
MNINLQSKEHLKGLITSDSKDYSSTDKNAWEYGIIVGWDELSLIELADKFNWSPEQVELLKQLHRNFEELK